MDTKKKVTDYDACSESPYVVELSSKYIQQETEHMHMKGEDGKDYGVYEIPRGATRVVDTAVYSKLFRGNTSLLMEMSEPATKMFYYITEQIGIGKDEVCILQEEYLKFAGYREKSRLTYYRAVEGLLKANVITRKTGSNMCYWINPNILFNGDRTKLKNTVVRPPSNSTTGFNINREND